MMVYLSTLLLETGTRWEMAGIAAAIAAALFSLLAALAPLRRLIFPPHVTFTGWALENRKLPEYRTWQHAKFCNRWSHWRASEALRCEAFAQIEQDGSITDHPEPLIVSRKPNPQTEWAMRRGQCDLIAVVFETPLSIVLGFDKDMGRMKYLTPRGVYLTDSHFILGASKRESLVPGEYRVRVRLEYDGRRTFSEWRAVSVPGEAAS